MTLEHTASTSHEQDIEIVEALLDDLDLGEDIIEDQPAFEAIDDLILDDANLDDVHLDDSELRDLDLTTAREEAYEEQESDLETDASAVEKARQEKKAKPARGARKVTAGAVSRAPRVNLTSMDAHHFVLLGDVDSMSDEDKEAAKISTLALLPPQKKIAEKFENTFQQLAVGKLPSVYIVQAFKLLDEKKTMSSTDLVAAFKATYAQGTAMSQAGQLMSLFAILRIAERSKNILTLNANSVIAERLREAILAAK